MQQEEAEKERQKEEEERRKKREAVKRIKRMLEAAFDGDDDEMLGILKEVRGRFIITRPQSHAWYCNHKTTLAGFLVVVCGQVTQIKR